MSSEYARRRRAEGVSDAAIARELGLSIETVRRWVRARSSAFVAATLVESPTSSFDSELVVEGPRGLRIVGMDVTQIAELWRRLS